MNHKPIERFALNDEVFFRSWRDEDDASWETVFRVRFAGVSGDGSIHFWARQQRFRNEEPSGPLRFSIPSVPTLPTFWQIVIRLGGDGLAVASWRVGTGPDDVQPHYYLPGDEGELFEVEPPPKSSTAGATIGFRRVVLEKE